MADSAALDIDDFVAFMLRTQEVFYRSFEVESNRLDFYFCLMSILHGGIDNRQNGETIYDFIVSNEIRGGISQHRVKNRIIELDEMGMLHATVDGRALSREAGRTIHALSKIEVETTDKLRNCLDEFIVELKKIGHPILISVEDDHLIRCFNLMWRQLRTQRARLIDEIIENYDQSLREINLSPKRGGINKRAIKNRLRLDANFWYMLFFIWLKNRQVGSFVFTYKKLESELYTHMLFTYQDKHEFLHKMCELRLLYSRLDNGRKTYYLNQKSCDLLTKFAAFLRDTATNELMRFTKLLT